MSDRPSSVINKLADRDELIADENSANRRRVNAARYVVHKLVVHKYATAVLEAKMTLEEAREHYEKAMKNLDGIMLDAAMSHTADALSNAAVAKGAWAIDEALNGK